MVYVSYKWPTNILKADKIQSDKKVVYFTKEMTANRTDSCLWAYKNNTMSARGGNRGNIANGVSVAG